MWAVGKFRDYLEGRKFQLYTDNSALQWMKTMSSTKSKLMRWALLLTDFDFDVCHVPGVTNQAADSLSRNPACGPEPSRELPEREIPTPPRKVQQRPVLMAVGTIINSDLIKKWQSEDATCKAMMDWILKHTSNPRDVPQAFKMCYKQLRLEKGLLMYTSQLSDLSPVAVVPQSKVGIILKNFHDDIEAGHPGTAETYNSIRRRFFWVNMRRDIANHIQSCAICACTKASNQKPSTAMRGRRPHQPWEIIALDLMGPYPRTSRGKTSILVVTDLFTRWVEAFAMPEATTNRILGLLWTEVFSRYGYPRCLLTDNGSQFTSRQWKNTMSEWSIEHWTTPIYNPRANPTERRNQELKKMLRIHLVDKEHKKWDQHLPEILLALRQRVNRSTGYSPAELFLGRPIYRVGDWELPGRPVNQS